MREFRNIALSDDGESLVIVDQTRLPSEVVFSEIRALDEMYEAIAMLRIRGAPAIGIFAGYCMYILANGMRDSAKDGFFEGLSVFAKRLNSARPTAVNLERMLLRMEAKAAENRYLPVGEIVTLMRDEAVRIHTEDMDICREISRLGLSLVKDGDGVLTHCNAGPLATSVYGTGLGPIFLAQETGVKLRVYCDETRPLLQGARLTAFELMRAGVDATLICDNMASAVMSGGKINACFVGCDRVAANGDAANKIGTSGVAILARHYNIPFYVFCPSTTIDFNCNSGADIEIEERTADEISTLYYSRRMAPEGVKCYNPAFDVTDNSLITAIITEKGILRPPYSDSLRGVF